MKLSVVIPVYNVEKYLSACIDSLLAQKYKDFELILVDDGSKDRSGEICEAYAKKHSNIVVIHKQNGGQGEARNVGLKAASGEYVFFMDSDDFLMNDEVLGQIAQRTESRPDVLFHKHVKWMESSGKYSACTYDYNIPTENRRFSEILCDLIDKDAYGNVGWNKVVRRELLVSNGIEFQNVATAEDNDWFYQVLPHMQSVVLIDEVFYVYRQREDSVSHGNPARHYDNLMWIIDKWSRYVQENPEQEGVKVIRYDLAYQYCNALINYCSMTTERPSLDHILLYGDLLACGNNPRVKWFRRISRDLGMRGLVFLLTYYIRIKKRYGK